VTEENEPRGVTVWFTGLPSSGKTTLSRHLAGLLSRAGLEVEVLDGDSIRTNLCRGLGFSKEDRDENIRRIGFVAGLLARHGVIVLVSAIAPYRGVREELRKTLATFVEVYVHAPLEICESRDVKGHYKKARNGEIKGFTGVDAPYEPPLQPDVECRTDAESVEESAAKVLGFLKTRYPHLAVDNAAVRRLEEPGRGGPT
jgi:adenylylsulfate kinase